MIASRLEANVHLITASTQEHNALVGAVNQAHLAVEETVFEPLAACYAAVLPEDRREGIAVVDIGAQSTDVVVYYGDALQLAASLPICGDHFTRDLARGLCVSYEDAELLKRQFGCAVASDHRRQLRRGAAPAREPRAARSAAPADQPDSGGARRGAVQVRAPGARARGHGPRADRAAWFSPAAAPRCRPVRRGRGACCSCQARKGLAVGIMDWPEEIDSAAWTTAAGLAMYSAS